MEDLYPWDTQIDIVSLNSNQQKNFKKEIHAFLEFSLKELKEKDWILSTIIQDLSRILPIINECLSKIELEPDAVQRTPIEHQPMDLE